MSDYMTTADVAEMLHMTESGLRYWRSRGEGPRCFKLGRRMLYAREDVHAFLAAARAAS